jgi:hypothetical protein
MNGQTFYQVTPRYTSGSPAQVDERTARRVAQNEIQAHADLDAGEIDRGLDGIVEAVTDVGDRRVIVDLITAKRTERTTRIQEKETDEAKALARDLRTVQDLITRRGSTWLLKWAKLSQGVEPGGPNTDPAFVEYVLNFPKCSDPRD